MPCEHISVQDDGQIICFNGRMGKSHGIARNPPPDLTEKQVAACAFWDHLHSLVKAVYSDFRVTVNEREHYTGNITLMFSIDKSSKNADRLAKDLQAFADDLTNMGCDPIFRQWEESIPPKSRWKFWQGTKRLFWQLTFAVIPSDMEGMETWQDPWFASCLEKVANVVQNTTFSEYLVPVERTFEDYSE